MKTTLWTKNYTLIILGTIISAIGGVGLNLALSVTVFDQTQSTWMTGLYSALTMIPTFVLPILVSPMIDRFSRRKIIYSLDYLMGGFFLVFSYITHVAGFNYYLYVCIGLIITLNSVVYRLAYNSLFPNLIPKGQMQQGYAVGNLIYPLTNVMVLPIATLVFKTFGVSFLFGLQGCFLLIAATCERFIRIEEVKNTSNYNIKTHLADIKEGFQYLWKEKGIWNVYLYFVIMMFADSLNILVYPFFEQEPTLTLIQYSFLLSLQSAGYMFGGFLHFRIKIPTHLRYAISVFVYFAFAFFDAIFFLMPFVIMVAIKFLLGILGMNSANIRVTSINAYIDDNKRGRLNAVFQTMVGLAVIFGKLVTGFLGEHLTFVQVGALYGAIVALGTLVFIVRNRPVVKSLYNREV